MGALANQALLPGQSLRQLASGSIAVIDPSVPTISGSVPAFNPGTNGPSTPGGVPPLLDHGDTDMVDPATYTPDQLAELPPADADISPRHTEDEYNSQTELLQAADQDSDGQAVAILTPPHAKDATGAEVPADISISGPDTIALTTHHRTAAYSYPVMTQHTTVTSTPARRHHWNYAIDAQDARSLYATCPNNDTAHCGRTSGQSDEGALKLRKALNATVARHIMTEGVCDKYATPGGDLSNLDPATDNYGAWGCRQAADVINAALAAGMRPFITIEWRHGKTLNPMQYADSMAKLWQVAPFNKVKDWAPTNEPNSGTLPANAAADIFRRVQSRARERDPITGQIPCPSCRMVAGEFSKDPPKSTSDTYIQDYIARLRSKGTYPMIWGFHDYDDVVMAPTAKHEFPELHNFIYKRLKVFSKPRRVWVTEQGVLLSNRGGSTRLDGRTDRQISAAQRFLSLNKVSRNIDQIGYFEFFGKANDWDSALVTPANPPEDPLTDKDFRPAYCVLTKRPGTDDLCAHTLGH